MKIDMSWIGEENWATDAMKEIAVSWFSPKTTKETTPVSPQLAGGFTFGDWVIPVSIVLVVVVVLLFVFKVR